MSSTRLYLVTGKGGVGKSTVAASLALSFAQQKQETLLAELDPKSFYASFFNLDHLNAVPQALLPYLWVTKWDPESCLKEYILHVVKSPALYKVFFENKVMRALIEVAPALKELALLGKMTSPFRKQTTPQMEQEFKNIIVDTFSTGHFLSLLRAPRGVGKIIESGPMGVQSRQIYQTLSDPEKTQVIITTLAQDVATTEALELQAILKSEFSMSAQVVCNRLLMKDLVIDDLKSLTTNSEESADIQELASEVLPIIQRQEFCFQKLSSSPLGLAPVLRTSFYPSQTRGSLLAEKMSEEIFSQTGGRPL